MADTKTNPSGREQDRDEGRRESEQIEQQDVNQGGLDTGTHNTTRHGVDWGPAYRGKKEPRKKKSAAESKPNKWPNGKI
jgi:hypothetical protein